MKTFILSTFLAVASLQSVSGELPSEDLRRSVFIYSKKQGLSDQIRALQDIVIFKDGSLLYGDVCKVPPLHLPFGKVELAIEEVAVIASAEEAADKMKVLTRSEECFVGAPENFRLLFKEKLGDASFQTIDMRLVDSVLVRSRDAQKNPLIRDSLHVKLTSGDQFPVCIAKDCVELTDGRSTRCIGKDQVVNLFFNGAVFGTVMGEGGDKEELPLSFAKHPTISFLATAENHHLQIPWSQIVQIFKRNHEASSPEGAFRNCTKLSSTDLLPNIAQPLFLSNHPLDRVGKVDFLSEPAPLFSKAEIGSIPEVEWIQGTPPQFSAIQPGEVPEGIAFIKEPPPVFDQRAAAALEEVIAVGEDFDLDDWEHGVEEAEEEPEDDVEFVSRQGEKDFQLIARGFSQKKAVEVAYRGGPLLKRVHHKRFLPPAAVSDDQDLDQEVVISGNVLAALNGEKEKKEGEPSKKRESQDKRKEYEGLIYSKAVCADGSGCYIKPRKVTNREYKKFVEAINYRVPIHWVGGSIPEGMENAPVVNVSYRDAFLYSVWEGKRLPTEEELANAVEEGVIFQDQNDHLGEWTSTPTIKPMKDFQRGGSVNMGRDMQPSHQVFSRRAIVSMNNDDANNSTGFRTAVDAH